VSFLLATAIPAIVIMVYRLTPLRRKLKLTYGIAGVFAVPIPLLEVAGPANPASKLAVAGFSGAVVCGRYLQQASRRKRQRRLRA
jgi:hypothetical protein